MNPEPTQPTPEQPIETVVSHGTIQPISAPETFVQPAIMTPAPIAPPLPVVPVVPTTQNVGLPGLPPIVGDTPLKVKRSVPKYLKPIVTLLVIIVGAGIAVYLIFFNVTKADYQQAKDQVFLMSDPISNSPYVPSRSDELAQFIEYNTLIQSGTKKFESLKAFRADPDIKERYDAYKKRGDVYVARLAALAPSYEKYVTFRNYFGSMSGSMFKESNVTGAAALLETLGEAPDPTVNAYFSVYREAYKKLIPLSKQYDSATGVELEKVKTEIGEVMTPAFELERTFEDDLREKNKQLSPTAQLNSLIGVVNLKYSHAK